MAETDILNPVPGFWAELGDSPTWNFGYTRKKVNNKIESQSRLGSPYSRDISNLGHTFLLDWVARPLATMQRLEYFYNNFKHGYFTLVDWDNGGRHYFGRFVAPPNPQETANNTYTAQGVQFQEIQRARMVQYPSNWEHDSYTINVLDDFLNARVNTMLLRDGVTDLGGGVDYVSPSLFVPQQTPAAILAGTSITDPKSYEMYNADGNPATFAQVEYVGWGFRMSFRLGPDLGIVDIYLDGKKLIAGFDLYSGDHVAAGSALDPANPAVMFVNPGTPGAGSVLLTVQDVPLDSHRVKVVPTRTKNAASTGYAAIYPPLQVMY